MRRSQKLKSRIPSARLIMSVASVAVLLSIGSRVAAAAPEIRGTASEMQLQAQEASVREILDALARSFNLTYQLSSGVNRTVSGRYSGSLRQVLARILDGHSYIIRETPDGTEVLVLGIASTASVAEPEPAPVSVTNPNQAPPSGIQKPVAEATSPPLRPLSSFR